MSDILKTVHETAKDLHEIGLMDDKKMSEFDELCYPDNQKSATKKTPNKETKKAIEEARAGIDIVKCKDADDMFKKLNIKND